MDDQVRALAARVSQLEELLALFLETDGLFNPDPKVDGAMKIRIVLIREWVAAHRNA